MSALILVRSTEAAASHPITLLAALLIGLCYYLSQSAWVAGIGFFTLYRPLVGGTLVGLILGAPLQGAQVGAAINLAYLSFVAAGGSLPSDISLAGYLGTALTISTGLDYKAALALTVPIGILGYLIFQLRMSLDIGFVRWAEGLAQRGSTRGWLWCNVLAPQALLLALALVPCAAAVYWGPAWLAQNLALIPVWLLGGLDGIGSLLPVAGLAFSLSLLWHNRNGAWFILGFLAAALTSWPLLALTLGVVCITWLSQPHPGLQTPAPVVLPLHQASRLQRGDLVRSWLNWLFFSHASYNYERMQGIGFAHSMLPIIRRLYPESEARSQALSRHITFFNSEPNLGAFIVGTAAAMEEQQVESQDPAIQAINSMKLGLMGAISGIGDSLIQGTWIPVALMLGIGLTNQLGLVGPLLYVILAAASVWGIGAASYILGYRGGRSVLQQGLLSGSWQRWLASLEQVGSAMLGVLLARVVQLQVQVTIPVGKQAESLQNILDMLLPKALLLGICLIMLALLKNRIKPAWVILGVALVGFTTGALGVI